MDPLFTEWLGRAKAGDAPAFRRLIEALADDLLEFATGLLRGDANAAQDVVQDVFVGLWRHLPRIRDAQHVRAWCFRVARCRALTTVRRLLGSRRRWRRVLLASPPGLVTEADGGPGDGRPADEVGEREPILRALDQAVEDLPSDYRASIRLHYLQGLDTKATASLLGVSLPTMKMRLLRARRALRRALTEPPPPPAGAPTPPPAPGGPP